MKIYKLNYTDKKTAIDDFIRNKVYNKDLSYAKGIHAIVEVGKVVKVEGTYDEEGNEITAPIYYDGYAYDVMCEKEIDFGTADITNLIKTPSHSFAGY